MNNRGTIFQYGSEQDRKQKKVPFGFTLIQTDENKNVQHLWIGDGKTRGCLPMAPMLLAFGLPYKNCQNQYFETASGNPTKINSYYLPQGTVIHRFLFTASRVKNAKIQLYIEDSEIFNFQANTQTDINQEIDIDGGRLKIELSQGEIDYGELLLIVSIDQRRVN